MRLVLAPLVALGALVPVVPVRAVEVEAEQPRLRIEVPPTPARAGAVVAVRVVAIDARGQPESSANVVVDADAGSVSAARRVGPGQYEATLNVPDRLPLGRSVLLLARTERFHAEVSLPLAPGPAATAALEGGERCKAGAESCTLELHAEDAFGNGAGEAPRIRADRGEVVAVNGTDPGRWVIAYRVPPVEREARAQLVAEVGAARATSSILLVPSGARLAFALRGGMGSEEGHAGPAAGGQVFGAGYAGGWLVGGGMDLGWWKSSRSDRAEAGGTTLDLTTDRTTVALAACGVAERALGGGLHAWLTATAGAARVTVRTQLTDQPAVTEAAWAPAAGGAIALGWHTRAGTPFLEGRLAWTGDPHLASATGSSTAFFLQLGYRFDAR
jgi:hypothetical protein